MDARNGAVTGKDTLELLNIGTVRQKGTKMTETPESGREIRKTTREKTECYLGGQDTHSKIC